MEREVIKILNSTSLKYIKSRKWLFIMFFSNTLNRRDKHMCNHLAILSPLLWLECILHPVLRRVKTAGLLWACYRTTRPTASVPLDDSGGICNAVFISQVVVFLLMWFVSGLNISYGVMSYISKTNQVNKTSNATINNKHVLWNYRRCIYKHREEVLIALWMQSGRSNNSTTAYFR